MKLIHGMTPFEFDELVAGRYTMKAHDCRNRDKEFGLTFAQFRKLYLRKFCAYTGVELAYRRPEGGGTPSNFATLERIDNLKGYVPGNCIVVTHEANQVKSVFESKKGSIDIAAAVKMFAFIGEHLAKEQQQ